MVWPVMKIIGLKRATSNGQSPFVTLFMNIHESDEGSADYKLIIEEVLKQRLEGMPNAKGVNTTPAFPYLNGWGN